MLCRGPFLEIDRVGYNRNRKAKNWSSSASHFGRVLGLCAKNNQMYSSVYNNVGRVRTKVDCWVHKRLSRGETPLVIPSTFGWTNSFIVTTHFLQEHTHRKIMKIWNVIRSLHAVFFTFIHHAHTPQTAANTHPFLIGNHTFDTTRTMIIIKNSKMNKKTRGGSRSLAYTLRYTSVTRCTKRRHYLANPVVSQEAITCNNTSVEQNGEIIQFEISLECRMCAKQVWKMGTHQTQVVRDEEKAKVESERRWRRRPFTARRNGRFTTGLLDGFSPGLLVYVFWCIFHFLSNSYTRTLC